MRRYAIVVLLLYLMAVSTHSQSTWDIPQVCDGNCNHIWVSMDGTLYATKHMTLYVIEYGATTRRIYDMQNIYPWMGIDRYALSLSDNRLLLFDVQSMTNELVLFDLDTLEVTPIYVDLDGSLVDCQTNTFYKAIPMYAFRRIGRDKVLLCSVKNHIKSVHITHLEGDRLVVEHSLEVAHTMPGNAFEYGWLEIGSSMDGKLYIVPNANTHIAETIAPDIVDSWSGYYYSIILRIDPETELWDYIDIDVTEERWYNNESTVTLGTYLVGVDEQGNLYIFRVWQPEIGTHLPELTKYSPDGEKLWVETEETFGEFFTRPLLLSEDRFVVQTDDGYELLVYEDNH